MKYIQGQDRSQITLFFDCIEDYVGEDNPVRVIDAFVDSLDLAEAGFCRTTPSDTGRPPYSPQDLEKRLRYISDYGASGGEKSDSHRKIGGFLRNSFHELQDFLPASTVGNTFGFVYEREKKFLRPLGNLHLAEHLCLN